MRGLDAAGKPCEIDSTTFDSQLKNKSNLLNENLRQNANKEREQQEISLEHQSGTSNHDNKKWVATLGEEGRVGIYKIETAHDEYEYVLIVQVGKHCCNGVIHFKQSYSDISKPLHHISLFIFITHFFFL